MNRIILIGNGFDLAHGLKTSYLDFIDWFWGKELGKTKKKLKKPFEDDNIKLEHILDIWYNRKGNSNYENLKHTLDIAKSNIIYKNKFLETITKQTNLQNWVDIEEEYYKELTNILSRDNHQYNYTIENLNADFNIIKQELEGYLYKECNRDVKRNDCLYGNIYSEVREQDCTKHLSWSEQQLSWIFLNFNYTNTVDKYCENNKPIYIHGNLRDKNSIIFGYGDEQNEMHKEIEKRGGNFLNNVKTINYLKTDNYRKVLKFLEMGLYQVFIMGHSCGLSDKTLLQTLFEHKHCISIKPFYHKIDDETDNYEDIIKNIYRIFTNKSLMRERVVNKQYCKPLLEK